MEISAGVFVGKVSARVRDQLWARVEEMAKDGRAIMVHGADTEQGLDFKVLRHDWTPVDLEGLRVMLRPAAPPEDLSGLGPPEPEHQAPQTDVAGGLRPGWSSAARRRRSQRRK